MFNSQRFHAHTFHNVEEAPFNVLEYSRMKFGSDAAAKRMGYELAVKYFNAHADVLIANRCLVFSSPYNYVPNAATVLTKHFIDRLNQLLVSSCGRAVEYSVIHRKVSYTNDYGFLSKEKRKGLIDNDQFYLNHEFLEDKLLICVDDVFITGTHEDKLREIFDRSGVSNDVHFLYYAQYNGLQPDIEAKINFASVRNLDDYLAIAQEPNHHIIIRPLKYILSQPADVVSNLVEQLDFGTLNEIYYGCLAEGYFKIPSYQQNFNTIASKAILSQ